MKEIGTVERFCAGSREVPQEFCKGLEAGRVYGPGACLGFRVEALGLGFSGLGFLHWGSPGPVVGVYRAYEMWGLKRSLYLEAQGT